MTLMKGHNNDVRRSEVDDVDRKLGSVPTDGMLHVLANKVRVSVTKYFDRK